MKKTANNTIDALLKYGENKKMGVAFAYAFAYVSDLCYMYLFDAQTELKKNYPALYRHNVKRLVKSACEKSLTLTSMIKVYIPEEWDSVIDNLEELRQKYETEFFILYNTLLKSSTKRFYDDYEMAKIITKLDVAQLAMTYWRRLESVVIRRLTPPLNELTCDYDVVIDSIRGNIYRLLKEKSIEPTKKGVIPLTPEEQSTYNGAMLNFGKSVANIYKEIADVYNRN